MSFIILGIALTLIIHRLSLFLFKAIGVEPGKAPYVCSTADNFKGRVGGILLSLSSLAILYLNVATPSRLDFMQLLMQSSTWTLMATAAGMLTFFCFALNISGFFVFISATVMLIFSGASVLFRIFSALSSPIVLLTLLTPIALCVLLIIFARTVQHGYLPTELERLNSPLFFILALFPLLKLLFEFRFSLDTANIILLVATILEVVGWLFMAGWLVSRDPDKTSLQKRMRHSKKLFVLVLVVLLIAFSVSAFLGFLAENDTGSGGSRCGHSSCAENGPFPCYGKNNTCSGRTYCAYDYYCSNCD